MLWHDDCKTKNDKLIHLKIVTKLKPKEMKTFKIITIVILSTFLLSSCGVNTALVANLNNNTTNVELSQKNFKVIEQVSGSSSAKYILGIGGIKEKALVEKAKAKMLENSNLNGSSKAIINQTTETHITMVFPFYYKVTVIVSAHIIEFY